MDAPKRISVNTPAYNDIYSVYMSVLCGTGGQWGRLRGVNSAGKYNDPSRPHSFIRGI